MPHRHQITASLADGLRSTRKRAGLILLLFVPTLVLAATASMPLYLVLDAATSSTGFGQYLIERFDLILITEIMSEARDGVLGALALIAWLAPVIILWKVACAVGVINAVRSGGIRSFWDGVGRYTGRALVLSLLNLAVLAVWAVVAILLAGLVLALMPAGSGPQVPATVAIALLVAGACMVGLAQDFSRVSLICDGHGILAAWRCGIRYPFRYSQSMGLYAVWWVVAAAVSLLLLETHVAGGASMDQVWFLFAVQQAILLARSTISVMWIASAVGMHERIRFREAPLIAIGAPLQPMAAMDSSSST